MSMDAALREIRTIAERVQSTNNDWSFADIARVKRLEQEAQKFPADFNRLRYAYNRDIAFQLNSKADIKVFLEEFGYVQKFSTKKWARYEKGENVLLITDSNGWKDVKSGETGNLFKLIEKEGGKPHGVSQTEYFIRRVVGCPMAEMFGTMHAKWVEEHSRKAVPCKASREHPQAVFSAEDYRLEKLDVHKNYLRERGISAETLTASEFQGSILQGNRRTKANGEIVPRWQNNIVYPFKHSAGVEHSEMATLLLQYGKKLEWDGKKVDKVFAAGGDKAHAAWFSNVPQGKVEHLYVVENPLDAMSHFQLYKPKNVLYMATGGHLAAGQLKLIDETAQKYGIAKKHLAFDNDLAGHLFDAQYLAQKTPQYAVKQGKDGDFTVEYKNLHYEQWSAMQKAAKDKPNAEFG